RAWYSFCRRAPRTPRSPLFPYTTLFRSRGFVIPKFVMNIVGDGGRTVVAPGGVVSVTRPSGDLDLVFSLGYALFLMPPTPFKPRSEEHTSELQSRENLVCRLLLEKNNLH